MLFIPCLREKWVSRSSWDWPGTLEKGGQGLLSALCLFADLSSVCKVRGRILGLENLQQKRGRYGILRSWLPLG